MRIVNEDKKTKLVDKIVKEDLDTIKKKFYHQSGIRGAVWRAVDLSDEDMKTLGKYGWKTMNDGRKHSEVILTDKEYKDIFNESIIHSSHNRIKESFYIDKMLEKYNDTLKDVNDYNDYQLEKKRWIEKTLKKFLCTMWRCNTCTYVLTDKYGMEFIEIDGKIANISGDSPLGIVEVIVKNRLLP